VWLAAKIFDYHQINNKNIVHKLNVEMTAQIE